MGGTGALVVHGWGIGCHGVWVNWGCAKAVRWWRPQGGGGCGGVRGATVGVGVMGRWWGVVLYYAYVWQAAADCGWAAAQCDCGASAENAISHISNC